MGKVLLVKGIAGLGNRLLCLSTAIIYALLTKRKLIIDWSDKVYTNDGSNAFDKFFHCGLNYPLNDLPSTDSVAPAIWKGNLRKSVGEMVHEHSNYHINHPKSFSNFSINISNLKYTEDVLIFWSYFDQSNSLKKQIAQDLKNDFEIAPRSIIKKVLKDYLVLDPEIQERVLQFKNNFFGTRVVGIHIRYADKKVPIKAMLKKLEQLIEHDPELQIFLATDNIDIKNYIENKYPRVISTPKWYPPPGQTMHNQFSINHDMIENGKEALVDMYLLSECNYLIIDESSSFAFISSLLTKAPSKQIFNFDRLKWMPDVIRHQLWIMQQLLLTK